jgi:hypothetical protein
MVMVQQRELLGRGWKFPFKIGGDSLSHDGPEQSKYEQHVIESIQHRILSRKWGRRFNRAFGTRFWELTFEKLTLAPGLAKQFIEDGIEQERRVILNRSNVKVNKNKSEMRVYIDISFVQLPSRANLVFPFYRNDQGRPSLTDVEVTIE